MPHLLTFTGAIPRQPAVDAWLDSRPAPLRAIARLWFEFVRQCGPDVCELMHDGCPTACVGDAAFAYVNVFTSHVNLGFFQGSSLPDPVGLLQGTGKFMRHVKLRPGTPINAPALEALVVAAYQDIVVKLRAQKA